MSSERRKTLAAAALLFVLNAALIARLFAIEFLDEMGSIEGTYIAAGRWILHNWGDLSWFPLWYGGIPWQNVYPPLLPAMVAGVAAVSNVSPAHAYHILAALFYSLGPVTLFGLAVRLKQSVSISFLGALFYSLVSPAALLVAAVRHDLGSWLTPWRLRVLVRYGEGPHVASLTLLPVALILLSLAFEKKRAAWWAVAACGFGAVALTNWLGAFSLAVAALAWMLSVPEGHGLKNWLKVTALAAWAYVVVSPLIPPSTILTIVRNEPRVSGALSALPSRLACFGVLFCVLTVLLWCFHRRAISPGVRFPILFLLLMGPLPLLNSWFHISLVHQPNRYQLEMEMALALAGICAAEKAFVGISRKRRALVLCALFLLGSYPAVKSFRYAQRLIRAIRIENTIEYREAKWFEKNMPGCRVMAPGSVGFFLNVFTNVPQYAGGFDQGVLNPLWAHVHYQVLSGENAGSQEGEIAVLWLKSFGVDAVAVSGPHGQEYYKPFRNPGKFEGLLPVLWRQQDDVIYAVPRRSSCLASVLRKSDLPTRTPYGGLDVDPIRPYVAALENSAYPLAHMRWQNAHSAVISAQLVRDQILSVQISYDPGWSAKANGQRCKTYGDHLHQLVIEPDCKGFCTVELNYEGSLESRLAALASWSGLLAAALWLLAERGKGLTRPPELTPTRS